MTLDLPEGLFKVVDFQHVKPGKGGAFVRTKLKNVRNGAVIDRTYRADEKLEQAIIDKREMQFLYRTATTRLHGQHDLRPAAPVASHVSATPSTTSRSPTTPSSRPTATEVVGVDLPRVGRAARDRVPSPGCRATACRGARKPATLETGLTRAGPAVRQHRRQGQGRHPLRRLHHPRLWSLPGRAAKPGRRALELLYEAETKGATVSEVLGTLAVDPDPFARDVAAGVQEHQLRIDELLTKLATDWPLDRMAVLDRAVLRMAVYELLERPDVPTAVVLDEAVELAKRYSTEESGRFVNGVLAAAAAELRPG